MERKVGRDVGNNKDITKEYAKSNDMSQAAADLISILLLCDRENLEYLRKNFVKSRVG